MSLVISKAKARFEALAQVTHTESTALVAATEAQKTKAESLVGLIAQTGMAGGFQKNENTERNVATVWAGIAAVSLAVLVYFSVSFASTAIGAPSSDGIHWETVIAKLVVTFSLAGLAGYAGRESSHHRVAERRYRQAELELSSLSPFLGDLKETDRHAMPKQFAERFFGQPLAAPPTPKGPQLPIKDTMELIKTLKE